MTSNNIGGLGIKCEKQKIIILKIQKTLADLGMRIDFLNINCIFLKEKYIIFHSYICELFIKRKSLRDKRAEDVIACALL